MPDQQASTDDRGMFRLSGLLPGNYVISVPLEEMSVPASLLEALPADSSPGKPDIMAILRETMAMSGLHLMRPGQGGTSVAVGDHVRGFIGGTVSAAAIRR